MVSIGKLGQLKYKHKIGKKASDCLDRQGSLLWGDKRALEKKNKSMSKNGKCQVIQVKQLVNCLFHHGHGKQIKGRNGSDQDKNSCSCCDLQMNLANRQFLAEMR